MANLLITGSSGGIGRHLCAELEKDHNVMPLSRRDIDSPFGPCDLVQQIPAWKGEQDTQVDWIVHLATTYNVEDDLLMLNNLIKFAKENEVKNFLYVSSWVVHFPSRPVGASYIEMKRQCERHLLESDVPNAWIVRPSVVEGDGLSWSKILKRLAPIAALLPPGFSRSFVSVEEVADCVSDVIQSESGPRIVTCLGRRMPLAEKAAEYRDADSMSVIPWLIGVAVVMIVCLLATQPTRGTLLILLSIFAAVWATWYGLPTILGSISDYFAGFVCRRFEPQSEDDLIALCHAQNNNIQVRGYDNARLYFQRPNSARHTTVSLRNFNQVLDLEQDRNLVNVQAGAHFGELLPRLESEGLWLDNYPNYHFISVGASIATAVHGSNLSKPFLADLVQSVRYYDRSENRIVELTREEDAFQDLIFNRDEDHNHVILSARLQTCPRQYYELTSTKKTVESLSFENAESFSGQTQHYEVRINTPMSKDALLQSYRQVPIDSQDSTQSTHSAESAEPAASKESDLLSIKADAIGRKWNVLQANALLSSVTSACSRWFINYEWFFTPEEFAKFWAEISSDRNRFRLYKLLIRYNRRQGDVNTPYHGTVSIDVTIFNTQSMLEISSDLYQRYQPLEHLGKYSIERFIKQRNEQQSVDTRSAQHEERHWQTATD